MRSRPTPDRNLPPSTVAAAPSVPVSVYKELATELQAAKALSEALNAQNQQLLRQNQQLQQQLDKAIDSVLYWRQANYAQKANRPLPNASEVIPFSTQGVSPEVTETEQGRYRRQSSEKVAEISGWSLAIAIVLIMVTAFGAGYFMMRPMVRSR